MNKSTNNSLSAKRDNYTQTIPFVFEKHPKRKGDCPECGHIGTFRYYADREGNRLEGFGKCERANNCGYHNWPTGKHVPKSEGAYISRPETVQIFPDCTILGKLEAALKDLTSPFHAYCRSMGVTDDHLSRWFVGTDKRRRTVYVFLDASGRIANAKYFTYMPTGKRDKTVASFSLKQPVHPDNAPAGQPEHRYTMPLYGAQFLRDDKTRVVLIVESEKTAVIASFFYPQYDWIAVGSANGLTDAKMSALYGRRLVWLADADGNQLISDKNGNQILSKGGRSNSSIDKLKAYQQNFCIIDLFPDRTDGSDIVDAIAHQLRPNLEKLLNEATELSQRKETDTTTIVLGDSECQIPTSLINSGKSDISGPETFPTPKKLNKPAVDSRGRPKEEILPKKEKLPKPRTDRPSSDEDEYEVLADPSVWYHKGSHNILVKGQRGWNLVAKGFFLLIRFMTEDENENQMWILEIKPDKNRDSIFIEVPHEDFCSASRLKRLITSKQFSLQITDTELSKLHEYLFTETEYKSAIKIIRFGFHADSGVFFFANAAVKDGYKLTADEFNIIETSPFYLCMPTVPKKGRHPFTLTENALRFNDWFNIYQQAHLYENAFIPACFYLMSLFRDIAIDYKNFSPILFLKGSAGTGKSSIVRNLTCLYGFKAKDINLKSKNTAAALVKLMSQSSNTVVWMDEFYNEFEHEGLLQAAYDNAGYHLSAGVGTRETAEIDIKSALALTSNYMPKNDIFFSRCLYIPINQNTKTAEQSTAYKKLLMLEDAGLGAITVEILRHRALIRENYDKGYTELYNGLTANVKSETPQRMKDNVAQVMTAAYILNVAGMISMTEYTEEADILAEFVRIGTVAITRQSHITDQHSPLSKFFAVLQALYDDKKLLEGVHFRIMKNDTISFSNSVFPIYLERYRRIHFSEGSPKDVIQEELVRFAGASGIEDITKQVRLYSDELAKQDGENKASGRACISVKYSLLVEQFSLDFGH